MKDEIELFTSGACPRNPGPGGWACILRKPGKEKLLGGNLRRSTNNRLELHAAIFGLSAIKKPSRIVVTTDCKYIVEGMTIYIKSWKAKNWSHNPSGSKPVKNAELWQELEQLCEQHEVTWHWVSKQSGHAENELVDLEATKQARLAQAKAKKALLTKKTAA
tara:strand:- start:54167 stop:54652 length:486 start_codon:yes stop_codon:yes gene_type:complete